MGSSSWAELACSVRWLAQPGHGCWHGYGAESAWIWIEQVIQNCIYAWLLVETGRCHLSLKKRLALGLTEPLVVNRVLLWFVHAVLIISVQIFVAVSVFIAKEGGEYPAVIDVGMVVLSSCRPVPPSPFGWHSFRPKPTSVGWFLAHPRSSARAPPGSLRPDVAWAIAPSGCDAQRCALLASGFRAGWRRSIELQKQRFGARFRLIDLAMGRLAIRAIYER